MANELITQPVTHCLHLWWLTQALYYIYIYIYVCVCVPLYILGHGSVSIWHSMLWDVNYLSMSQMCWTGSQYIVYTTIDPSHKSQNASDKYPTMHPHIALWDMPQMHSGMCEMGLLTYRCHSKHHSQRQTTYTNNHSAAIFCDNPQNLKSLSCIFSPDCSLKAYFTTCIQ